MFFWQAEASVRHMCEKTSEAKQVFACHSCSPHTLFAVASLCLKEECFITEKLIVKRMGQLSFDSLCPAESNGHTRHQNR